MRTWIGVEVFFQEDNTLSVEEAAPPALLPPKEVVLASGKTTPWASQDIPGYPCIDFVDWDNPG